MPKPCGHWKATVVETVPASGAGAGWLTVAQLLAREQLLELHCSDAVVRIVSCSFKELSAGGLSNWSLTSAANSGDSDDTTWSLGGDAVATI